MNGVLLGIVAFAWIIVMMSTWAVCFLARNAPLIDEQHEDEWPEWGSDDMHITMCPHGNEPADCNDCMIESDFAFDSWRESRV